MLARCFSHIFSIDCPRQISMLLISLFPLNFRVVNESGEQHPTIRSHGSRTRVATKKTKGLPISNSHTSVANKRTRVFPMFNSHYSVAIKKTSSFPMSKLLHQSGHQKNEGFSDVQFPLQYGHQENQQLSGLLLLGYTRVATKRKSGLPISKSYTTVATNKRTSGFPPAILHARPWPKF